MLDDRFAAGNCNRRARDVTRHWIGQHDVGGREFGGLAWALRRYLLAEVPDVLLRHGRWDKGCPDRRRSDGVGSGTLVGQHLSKACRKILERALRRGIGEQVRARTIGIDRRGVDDRTSRLHVRHSSLRQIEHRMDVGTEVTSHSSFGISPMSLKLAW